MNAPSGWIKASLDAATAAVQQWPQWKVDLERAVTTAALRWP